TSDLNGGVIKTTGTQEYNGAVTLSTTEDLTGSAVTFDSTVDALASGVQGLTVTGATTFKDAVGGTTKLASLLINGTSDLNGGVIKTTGTQEYNGAVTLSTTEDLTGSAVTFDSTVDALASGVQGLTVTGATTFKDAVGGTTKLASLLINGTSDLNGGVIKTTGTQEYNGAVTLSTTEDLTGSAVTFDSTVDALASGVQGLTVTGATTFKDAVGGTTKLASLLINGTSDLNGGVIKTTG